MKAVGLSLAALIVLCAMACAEQTADEPQFEDAAHKEVHATRAPQTSGRAALRLLPRDSLLRSKRGLVVLRNKDGVSQLHLQGRFQHATVAVVDENGVARASCLSGSASDDAAEDPR
jgi:hypothetical protein